MGNSVEFAIKNYKNVKKNLDKMRKAPKKVIERTMSDFRSRAPGWIGTEVAKAYNIKKAELQPGAKTIGTVKIKGDDVKSLRIEYKGRLLTHTHFGMSPTSPSPAYSLKATVIKGQRKTLGKVKKLTKKQRKNIGKNFTQSGTRSSNKSPIMLMHTGNKKAGGTSYIPFQRVSANRNDIKAIKTISMPQMVSNEKVAPNIQKAIEANMGKRIEHHMKLLEKE